jgi:Leucine-rich repeat (LRR) protein
MNHIIRHALTMCLMCLPFMHANASEIDADNPFSYKDRTETKRDRTEVKVRPLVTKRATNVPLKKPGASRLKFDGTSSGVEKVTFALDTAVGSDLTRLSVINVRMDVFTTQLEKFVNLEKLRVENCWVQTFKGDISKLQKLKTLILADNLLRMPPEQQFPTSLTKVELRYNKLGELPHHLLQLPLLASLDLEGNQLSLADVTFAQLTALTWLDVSRNRLTALPDGLQNLPALTTLIASRNYIAELPPLGSYTSLKKLYLDRNNLSSIPDCGNAMALEILCLQHNRFTEFPEELTKISSLKLLNLRGNGIASIGLLDKLPHLVYLNLERNRLVSIDGKKDNMPQLQVLALFGNQLPDQQTGIWALICRTYESCTGSSNVAYYKLIESMRRGGIRVFSQRETDKAFLEDNEVAFILRNRKAAEE